MEIRQFRVVLRAKSYDRTTAFYGEILGLRRIDEWESGGVRGALFQAGPGVIEVLGRSAATQGSGRDELFDYQGPHHEMTITLIVPSAQKAYEDLQFRERNIPGGLKKDVDGAMVFETHDPDGIKVACKEAR